MLDLLISVDGGGALGCGPLRFLALAEKAMGEIKAKGYGGASTGSICIGSRLVGNTWARTEEIFLGEVHNIFHDVPLTWKFNPMKPKYMNDQLIAVCKRVFGDVKCFEIETPFYIPSFDFTLGRPKIFSNQDTYFLWEAIVCSCSAETFFAPYYLKGPSGLVHKMADGGTVSNNPSAVTISGVHHDTKTSFDSMKVLSLATGGSWWDPNNKKVDGNMLPTSWIKPVLNACIDGNEELFEYMVNEMVGENNQLRIDPNCQKNYDMDNLKILTEYQQLWETQYTEQEGALRLFLAQ